MPDLANDGRAGDARDARDVSVHDDGIRLGQLLKLADLAASGADAKALLAEGVVEVNGVVDQRRGRQLVSGDVVRVGDQAVRLVSGCAG